MKYRIEQPIKYAGVRYSVGDTVPQEVFADNGSVLAELLNTGTVVGVEEELSFSEMEQQAEREAEGASKKKQTPNLQALKIGDAVELVSGLQGEETLGRLLTQETNGKARKTVLDAIKRQIRIYA